jgi:hypothetical protein
MFTPPANAMNRPVALASSRRPHRSMRSFGGKSLAWPDIFSELFDFARLRTVSDRHMACAPPAKMSRYPLLKPTERRAPRFQQTHWLSLSPPARLRPPSPHVHQMPRGRFFGSIERGRRELPADLAHGTRCGSALASCAELPRPYRWPRLLVAVRSHRSDGRRAGCDAVCWSSAASDAEVESWKIL